MVIGIVELRSLTPQIGKFLLNPHQIDISYFMVCSGSVFRVFRLPKFRFRLFRIEMFRRITTQDPPLNVVLPVLKPDNDSHKQVVEVQEQDARIQAVKQYCPTKAEALMCKFSHLF